MTVTEGEATSSMIRCCCIRCPLTRASCCTASASSVDAYLLAVWMDVEAAEVVVHSLPPLRHIYQYPKTIQTDEVEVA